MKVQRCLFVLSLLVLLAAGAPGSGSATAGLEITQVTPTTVYNDLDTTLTVTGNSFTADAEVFLGGVALQVTAVDTTLGTITAVVPWGMEPGVYALSVRTPVEQTSRSSAVTVEQGLGQWISNGPFGGEVTQILQAPQGDAETRYPYAIYAVTRDVGIFRSTDSGAHWQFVFASGSPDGNLAMDAANPNLLYATKIGEGLYRSQDGGDTWEATPFDFQNVFGLYHIQTARAFPHPATGGTVYAALNYSNRNFECMDACGVYKSTNAGVTWTRISAGIDNSYSITALAFTGTALYAGASDGKIFRSADDGATWAETSVNWNSDPTPNHVSKLIVQPSIGDLFWITEGEGFSGLVYRCEEINNAGTISLSCVAIDGAAGSSSVMDVQFSPHVTGTGAGEDILAAGNQITRSINDGLAWKTYVGLNKPFQSAAVAYDRVSADRVYAGNMQGVYRNDLANQTSELGYSGNWTKYVEGMAGLAPTYLVTSPSQPQSVYVNTNGSGIFHSTNGGASWAQLPNFNDGENEYTLKAPLAVNPTDDQDLIIATTQNKVMLSSNGGQSWVDSSALTVPAAFSGYNFLFSFIEPIPGDSNAYLAGGYFADPNSGDNHAYPGGGLYKTMDGGVTWTLLYANADLGRIHVGAFDPIDPQTIYCGTSTTDTSDYPARAALLYSTDGGQTWDTSTYSDEAGFVEYNEIITLAVRPSTGELFVDNGMDVVAVNPLTDSWTRINGIEAAQAAINQLLFVPGLRATPETLYAATMAGLFQSTDGGVNWAPASAGLVGANVTVLDYAPSGGSAGIVYTGLAGGALAGGVPAMSAFSQPVDDNLIDGGVYHLTRVATDYAMFLPSIAR